MNSRIDVTGVEGIINNLNNLGGTLADVAYETGLSGAARVVAREARQTSKFKDKTGNLRASIGTRRGLPRFKPSWLVLAKAPHAGFITIGTKLRFHRSGKSVGKIVGVKFLTEAAENTKTAQLQAFKRGVDKEGSKINRELARGSRIRRRTLRNL